MSTELTRLDATYETDPYVREHIDEAAASRKKYVEAVGRLAPYLPELPDADAYMVFDTLRDYERFVAPTDHIEEYVEGSAHEPDEVVAIPRGGSLLLSAEHATNPIRKATGVMGSADHGTAGLSLLLAENPDASVVLAQGRQTGNANGDSEHPLINEVELSRSLRLVPRVLEFRDEREKIMAVYLGYLATRTIAEIVTPAVEL